MNKIPTTTNVEGQKVYIVSSYAHCGEEWTSAWDSACDDECPVCGQPITPTYFEEVKIKEEHQ